MSASRVAVVGLGVAGTAVATLLAGQGHDVTVFEQTPNPGPAGAGVLLQPSGQLVLERMGLLDAIKQNAEPIRRLRAVTHRGKLLIDLPYAELGSNACAYGIHRGVLFTALFNALRKTSAKVRLNVRASHYQNHAGYITLTDDNALSLGDFDMLLACDGARSPLRHSCRTPMRIHEYPHGALWANGRCAAIKEQLWQVTRGSRRLCGLLPMGGGDCSLFWSLEKKEKDPCMARGFNAWREEVLELCPQAAEIFETVHNFDRTRYTTYMHVRMTPPFEGRCAFLGDAAHAMSPHLGQGINLALLDAYYFAQSMKQNPLKAFQTYAHSRKHHVNVYAAVTCFMSPFFQSPGITRGLLRDIFLPLMPYIPPLRRQMITTMSGMRARFLGGTLRVN